MKKTEPRKSTDNDVDSLNLNAKKAYSAPQIMSVEKLEAAAATCSPTGPVEGKSFPAPCSVLGS